MELVIDGTVYEPKRMSPSGVIGEYAPGREKHISFFILDGKKYLAHKEPAGTQVIYKIGGRIKS